MRHNIKTVVFPVAGLGTRFLPATKASPKEMLPVVDKPLIQYAAEEAVAAGAELLVFVTARNKGSISCHFDRAVELEQALHAKGDAHMADWVGSILPSRVSCAYVHQHAPLGLGHAVLCAEHLVGDDPFAVILPDDLIHTGRAPGCLEQMCARFRELECSLVAVEDVPPERTGSYGIVAAEPSGPRISEMTGIVEKPEPAAAPSTLGVVGRYLFTPAIFDHLRRTGRGSGGEIQLTDAISDLLDEESVVAYRFQGKRYDCGDKLGYLRATVEYALRHPQLGEAFAQFLDTASWQDIVRESQTRPQAA